MKTNLLHICTLTFCAGLLAALPLGCNPSGAPPSQSNSTAEMKILTVDDVAESPEKYTGQIAVEGRVTEVAENGLFTLGCDDACVAVPVKFAGAIPPKGRDVVVHGEIKKTDDGEYLFDAKKVTVK